MPENTPDVESRFFKVAEIAQRWNLSDNAVRNLFFDEPGVLRIGQASRLLGGRSKKLRRHYFILRIPESVLLRLQGRLTAGRDRHA